MRQWPTPQEAVVLLCVIQEGPIHGLEITRKVDVTRGSVYVLLSRLVDKGLILSGRETTPPAGYMGIARRLYWPSPLGCTFKSALEALSSSNTSAASDSESSSS